MVIGKMFVLTYANGPIMLFRPTCIYILKKEEEKKKGGTIQLWDDSAHGVGRYRLTLSLPETCAESS